MGTTIWKGVVSFATVRVPVRFLSAVQDRAAHFHLVHVKDGGRLRQRMVNAASGEPVAPEKIRRRYSIKKGEYVFLSAAELEKLRPPTNRTIAIESFVPTTELSPQWFERPYYLAPDGETGEYAALVGALSKRSRAGLARWVMRNREYTGLLLSENKHLLMIALHSAEEVVPMRMLPISEGRAPTKLEVGMAEQLVSALTGPFDPREFRDEHQQRIDNFVRAKLAGKRPRLRLVHPPKPTAREDLAKVLKASLRGVRKERAGA